MAITVPVTGTPISSSTFGIPVANAINTQLLGENVNNSSVTLSTTAAFAGLATVTFTLSVQTRVRIDTMAAYQMASGTSGHMNIKGGYNSGSSAVIGSFTGVGQQAVVTTFGTGSSNAVTGTAVGTALLAAGTYTAYASVTRSAGGSATDIALAFYCAVTAIGFN